MAGARLSRNFPLVFLALLTLTVAGCGGDDGERGPRGEAGPPPLIGERTVAPDEVNPKITDASAASPLVVDFQVTDERGFAVVGIEASAVDFTVNKLVPGSNGETNNWRSYVWGDDQGTVNAQVTTLGADSGGTLVDNRDGTYTFTFDEMPGDLSSKAGTIYEPSLTHRVGIELRGVTILGREVPAGRNAVYDFRPSDGATSGITKREIAETESCQTCHGPEAFSFHGGPRKDVEYCVTCHQKGSIDVGTTDSPNNAMDFRVMIHKIHTGENLNVVLGPDGDLGTADDGVYEFCGFACEAPFIGGGIGSPTDDFSHVAFPQDTRNCTTCHDPSNPDTPQASNVFNRPTAAVCASCHDDLAFDDTGLTNANGNHEIAKAQPNSTCANCHTVGGLSAENAHKIPEQVWAARFEYNIVSMSSPTAPGGNPTVEFSITDPTDGDAPYDIASDPEFTGSETSISMLFAWPTSDYTNVTNDAGTDTDSRVSRPISVPLVTGDGSTATLNSGITGPNADGEYTLDTSASTPTVSIPNTSPTLGSGAVVIEGHPSGDFNNDSTYDDSVPVTSAVDYFDIDSTGVQARREVVDPAKCQVCHNKNDGLAFHGGNRVDNTQVCVVCHNPNQTDLNRRPHEGTTTATLDGSNSETVDGLEDQSVDFKYMIHAIHGSEPRVDPADGGTPYVAYGFRDRAHDYSDAGFPRPASDCLACHREGTYALPVGSNVLATTLNSGSTWQDDGTGTKELVPGDGTDTDPTDDNNASATAAVCWACHNSQQQANHMDRFATSAAGNAFLLNPDPIGSAYTQSTIESTLSAEAGENCVLCHGPGSVADVAKVHGVE